MPPLSDIRVVTMALNAPGPLAAARMREAGATVVKVEPPSGDPLSVICPAWYEELHRGIRVHRINLKTANGRERMYALLGAADLFLASQRPAALAKLGLDADTLLHPRSAVGQLRHLNIVGEIARPEIAGHDLTYLARAGLLGSEMPRTLIADVLGSERAFSTALLLLRQPPGSRAEVGLYDALEPMAAPMRHGLTGPGSILEEHTPGYRVYATKTGRVAVAALEPHFLSRLYQELDINEGGELPAAFLARTAMEWEQWADERDLPITAVR